MAAEKSYERDNSGNHQQACEIIISESAINRWRFHGSQVSLSFDTYIVDSSAREAGALRALCLIANQFRDRLSPTRIRIERRN